MSNQLFEHQVVPHNSSTSPVENLANEVASAFSKVEDKIGVSTITPDLGKVLGNFVLADLSYHGVEEDFSEVFSYNSHTKDLNLTAVPTDSLTVSYVDSVTKETVFLEEKLPTQLFTDKNQFKRNGRVISLSSSFDEETVRVAYRGITPLLGGTQTRPNVLSNTDGTYLLPLEEKASGVYSISYDWDIQANVQKFYNGSLEDTSNLYVIAKTDDTYKVLKHSSIYFSSNMVFVNFEEYLEEDYEEVLLYILNTTVASLIEALYKELKDHTHSREGFSKSISHTDLLNTFQNTSEIIYKDLNVVNYEHPQYINREGHNSSLTSVYENAMLGDFFLGSPVTETDQVYKTILKDSVKILFGEPFAGSKLYYDSSLQSLNLLSGSGLNGLNIAVATDKKALSINNDSTYISETKDKTVFKGKSDVVKIESTLEVESIESSGKATLNNVELNTVKQGGVSTSITDNSSVKVSVEEDSELKYEGKVKATDLTIEGGNIQEVVLTGSVVASENSRLTNSNGDFIFEVNQKDIVIDLKSGLKSSFKMGLDGLYQKTYAADYLGQKGSVADISFYTELPNNSAQYFLKEVGEDVSHRGSLYSFQKTVTNNTRIDSLKEWIRADLFAGDITAYKLTLLPSDLDSKNGISIGNTTISVIGSGLDCPEGTTVFESADSFHFTKQLPSTGVDCSSVSYQSVNTGTLQVFGKHSVDEDLLVMGNTTIGGSLAVADIFSTGSASFTEMNVSGLTSFTGDTTFVGSVLIKNDATVTGGLNITGSLKTTDGNFEKYVTIGETLTVGGQTFLNDNVIVQGTLYTSEDFTTQGKINSGSIKTGEVQSGSIYAQGSITIVGSLSSEGSGSFKGSLTTEGSARVAGNIDVAGEVTADSLYVISDTTLSGRLTTTGTVSMTTESFTVGSESASLILYGNLQVTGARSVFSGDVTLQNDMTVGGNARFGSAVTISGELSTASLKVESGAVVGGTLKASSADFDRKIYLQDGFKASGTSEFTEITGTTVTAVSSSVDDIYIKKSLTMGPSAVISAYQVESSRFIQKDPSLLSTFAGPTSFASRVNFSNLGVVVGNEDILTTRNTSGCLITDSSVTLGNNSTVKATKIFANKGTPSAGNRDLNAGFCFSANLAQGGEDGDTGIFSTSGSGSGLDGSDIEVWIDGARKYAFYATDVAYNANKAVYGKAVVTLEMLQALQASLVNQITGGASSVTASSWPVGSIFLTTNDATPYALFGFGTWVRYAPGRTLVGKVTGSSNETGGVISDGVKAPANWVMSQTGRTYGSYEETLGIPHIPPHNHRVLLNNYNHGKDGRDVSTAYWANGDVYDARSGVPSNANSILENTGGGLPHNNVQPSIVVNMWNRVA